MAITPPALADYAKRIAAAASAADLDAIEQELFGRKSGVFTLAMKELGNLSPEEKKTKGQELNVEKMKLTQALEDKRAGIGASSAGALASEDPLDVSLELPSRHHGHLHLIPEFLRQAEEVFGRMGFDVARGPEVETEEYNFDLLNFPMEHSARDAQDIFFLDPKTASVPHSKKSRPLLRAHTSTVQLHYMKSQKPPFRMICPGRVYRKDADATHSPMFHQVEGLMIGRDVSLANMKAVMITAIRELIAKGAEFRFRTGYFPFVEPGLEVDMRWQGDEAQSREGRWLEIAGCGMVHPNVLKNVGIDPDEFHGFAFGFGVERMIMIRNQIPDLRSFYHGDLRFLEQFC